MLASQLFSLLNLRSIEIKLYEALFYGGTMSASQIARQINISRTSVYDLLEHLITTGLVTETLKGGLKMFVIQPPEKIQLLITEKEKEILIAKQELTNLRENYNNKRQSIKPQLQLFEGRKALQQMMKDLLLYRDITVQVYWPINKIVKLLSSEFLIKFHQERVARNIKIKVLWPPKQILPFKKYPFLKVNAELKREVRIAPPNTDFSLGYTIYGNTVRFISSSQENFGFLVESSELAEMMKGQFKLIWNLSKPFTPKK